MKIANMSHAAFCEIFMCAGRDAGRGNPGDAAGLHLTVSGSKQK